MQCLFKLLAGIMAFQQATGKGINRILVDNKITQKTNESNIINKHYTKTAPNRTIIQQDSKTERAYFFTHTLFNGTNPLCFFTHQNPAVR